MASKRILKELTDFDISRIMQKLERHNNGSSYTFVDESAKHEVVDDEGETAILDGCMCSSNCCNCCPCRGNDLPGVGLSETPTSRFVCRKAVTPTSRARKKKLLFPDETGTYALPDMQEDEFDTPNKRVANYVSEHADSDVSWIMRKLDRYNNSSTDTSEYDLPGVGLSETPTMTYNCQKAVTPSSRARKKKLLFPDETGTYAFPDMQEDEFDTPNKRVANYVLASEHADSDVSWIMRKLDRYNNDSTDTSEVGSAFPAKSLSKDGTSPSAESSSPSSTLPTSIN